MQRYQYFLKYDSIEDIAMTMKEIALKAAKALEDKKGLRVRLLACIEKDAAAFEPLSRAYGIPKDDPSRAEVMEACLRDAAGAPMEIFDLCCEAICLEKEFAEKGSRIMISDAATGAALCLGALKGAAVNVRVNTRLMKDRAYAEALDARIGEGLRKYGAMAEEVYENVYGSF